MARPKLLLLDEPSMGLAPMLAEQILANVAALKTRGLTVLLVEQNAHAALSIADRAYVLETGRVTLSGESALLRNDARVREAYLGL
jgi:branched-chain amino acid transport system ATP-binding protein